ncbi:MAG TPA: M20/M25/M40 family metallo-hydrolase [Candidatus Nitrosocosmicus sp.]|nr:M20/M25/M40 family metallo-hydrolase [Candidatus Nitrosocosmicus sp.]
MAINDIISEIDTNKLINDLQRLIKISSVSARKQNLEECANEIVKIMREIGIFAELIYLNKNEKNEAPPIVYGEIKSKSNPNGKTILFYNHYDVQPEEPLDLWEFKPFEGIVKGNKIFGRGASDDKGELITRLSAVEYFLKHTGDVPINIKFLVEGEEETGSNNISNYINKYKNKLETDLVIWEFGYIDQKERPIISLGMKGLLYVEMTAIGPSRDVHSSLAVLIENPAWKLVQALSTLVNKDGTILVKDWHKEVKKLTEEEVKMIENEPFDEESFKKEYGIKKFVNNISGKNIKRALTSDPSCNISGLVSGYTGEGAKTILPSKASVKIDFRLVPDMDPKLQFQRLKKHLEENGFGDIQITNIHGEASGRTEINNPYVKIIQESASKVFGDSIISVSSAGTGPMYDFINILKVPCISIGGTYIFSRIHSPNEYARIDLLEKTTKCIITIINNISKI